MRWDETLKILKKNLSILDSVMQEKNDVEISKADLQRMGYVFSYCTHLPEFPEKQALGMLNYTLIAVSDEAFQIVQSDGLHEYFQIPLAIKKDDKHM